MAFLEATRRGYIPSLYMSISQPSVSFSLHIFISLYLHLYMHASFLFLYYYPPVFPGIHALHSSLSLPFSFFSLEFGCLIFHSTIFHSFCFGDFIIHILFASGTLIYSTLSLLFCFCSSHFKILSAL